MIAGVSGCLALKWNHDATRHAAGRPRGYDVGLQLRRHRLGHDRHPAAPLRRHPLRRRRSRGRRRAAPARELEDDHRRRPFHEPRPVRTALHLDGARPAAGHRGAPAAGARRAHDRRRGARPPRAADADADDRRARRHGRARRRRARTRRGCPGPRRRARSARRALLGDRQCHLTEGGTGRARETARRAVAHGVVVARRAAAGARAVGAHRGARRHRRGTRRVRLAPDPVDALHRRTLHPHRLRDLQRPARAQPGRLGGAVGAARAGRRDGVGRAVARAGAERVGDGGRRGARRRCLHRERAGAPALTAPRSPASRRRGRRPRRTAAGRRACRRRSGRARPRRPRRGSASAPAPSPASR